MDDCSCRRVEGVLRIGFATFDEDNTDVVTADVIGVAVGGVQRPTAETAAEAN